MKRKLTTRITAAILILAIGTMSFTPAMKAESLVTAKQCSLTKNGIPVIQAQNAQVTAAIVAAAELIAEAAVAAAVELSPEALLIFILGGDNSSKSTRNVNNAKYMDELTKIKMAHLDPAK